MNTKKRYFKDYVKKCELAEEIFFFFPHDGIRQRLYNTSMPPPLTAAPSYASGSKPCVPTTCTSPQSRSHAASPRARAELPSPRAATDLSAAWRTGWSPNDGPSWRSAARRLPARWMRGGGRRREPGCTARLSAARSAPQPPPLLRERAGRQEEWRRGRARWGGSGPTSSDIELCFLRPLCNPFSCYIYNTFTIPGYV